MKRISDTEYVVVDKKAGTVRLWHECNIKRRKRESVERVELEQKEPELYVCPNCGYERRLETGLLLR